MRFAAGVLIALGALSGCGGVAPPRAARAERGPVAPLSTARVTLQGTDLPVTEALRMLGATPA